MTATNRSVVGSGPVYDAYMELYNDPQNVCGSENVCGCAYLCCRQIDAMLARTCM